MIHNLEVQLQSILTPKEIQHVLWMFLQFFKWWWHELWKIDHFNWKCFCKISDLFQLVLPWITSLKLHTSRVIHGFADDHVDSLKLFHNRTKCAPRNPISHAHLVLFFSLLVKGTRSMFSFQSDSITEKTNKFTNWIIGFLVERRLKIKAMMSELAMGKCIRFHVVCSTRV